MSGPLHKAKAENFMPDFASPALLAMAKVFVVISVFASLVSGGLFV